MILGYLPSFCEGDVISGGKGSCAAFAFDGRSSGSKVISCGNRNVPICTNLCSEFRTALCTKIILRTYCHILLALEFLSVKGDVLARREKDTAVFAECGKCRSCKSNVLSCAHNKNALIALDGDPGGRIQYILMGKTLGCAAYINIVFCFKDNGFITDDRT